MHLFETWFCQPITSVIDYQYHLSKKTSLLHDYYSADCRRILVVASKLIARWLMVLEIKVAAADFEYSLHVVILLL